jgi:hypothetical protein
MAAEDGEMMSGQSRVRGSVYLLIHTSLSASAKDSVAAYQAGEKGVVWPFFSAVHRVQVPDEQHGGLVYGGEVREVAGMLASGF